MPAKESSEADICPNDDTRRKIGPKYQTYAYNGDIAISGISGRFPESGDMEEFRDHLLKNEDMVTEDDRRWKVGQFGTPPKSGKVKDIHVFDSMFFGVHSYQAICSDPQLKMLLECSYEAIVDAGKNLQSMKGTKTGVYIGARLSECAHSWGAGVTNLRYSCLGCCPSIFANRISWSFGLNGPSIAVTNSGSSSLTCLESAVTAIRMGIIDAAIVGGANVTTKFHFSCMYDKLGLLSRDGLCKSFDASGDGLCRSEAASVIFLEKAEDCRRIYATVAHAKSAYDGFREKGYMIPARISLKKMFREFYDEAGISPNDISYIEAHGVGSKEIDEIEGNAIVSEFCSGRDRPLLIGSVKSNIGHTDNAAGIASIAKVVVAMKERVIPANLHYKTPNPNIPALVDGRLKMVTENTPWNGGLVAINALGLWGSTSHAVLRSYDKMSNTPHVASKSRRLFTCFGRTEKGASEIMAEARKYSHSVEFQTLLQDSANMPPNLGTFRGYTILNNSSVVEEVQKPSAEVRPIWFVYSGMGSQWPYMGRKMMELDIFRESILRSSKTLSQFGINLYNLFINGNEDTFNEIIPSLIGITAVQIALTDLLTAMDIVPDGIIGHSLGETCCAYADGCLTAEETILAAYWRGRCVVETKTAPGKMAAVGLTWEECKRVCPPGVVPACHNSEDTVTISGPKEDTARFMEELKAKGVFVREVNSSNMAYHSYFMDPVAPKVQAAYKKFMTPKLRSSKWISTSVPEDMWDEDLGRYCSAEYYVNNLVSPVLFQEGLQKIPANALAIEIGPHGLLQAILKRSLNKSAVSLGLMKRLHEDNVEFFFSSLGRCFVNGMDFTPLKIFPPVSFPVPLDTPMVSPCISKMWDHSIKWDTPVGNSYSYVAGKTIPLPTYDIDISENSEDHYLIGHKVDGRILYPATGYLVLVWKTLAEQRNQHFEQLPVVFEDVQFHRAVVLPLEGTTSLAVRIMTGSGKFEIYEKDAMVVSGIVCVPENPVLDRHTSLNIQRRIDESEVVGFTLTREDIYKELRLKGYEYGPTFQGIIKTNSSGEKGELAWDGKWIPFMDTMLQLTVTQSRSQGLRLPTRIKSVRVDPRLHPSAPTDGQDPIALPAYVKKIHEIVICGGIEIKGLQTSIAPRRAVASSPVIEHYSFVPYTKSMSCIDSSSLEKYCNDCLHFVLRSLRTLVKEDTGNMLLNKEMWKSIIDSGGPTRNLNLTDYSDQPNSALAQVLVKIFNTPVSAAFMAEVQSLMYSFRDDLSKDRILSSLSSHETLKPCIDIVIENINAKKITVLEAGASESVFYRTILSIFKTNPTVSVSYTAADKAPLPEDAKNLGVTASQWDPASSKSVPEGQYHLLVFKNILHKQPDILKALETFSAMLAPGGFILIEEITKNFPLYAALEGFREKVVADVSGIERVCGWYLIKSSWMNIFSKSGFEVIYERSNDLLSTIFLLRKTVAISSTPLLVQIDDIQCSWLQDLKSKMKQLEDAPADARLWLVSKQDNSGLMGLVNCLRLEAGGDKIRSIFVSNLKTSTHPVISANSLALQNLARKDLVANVYRDGVWGSFRHMAISNDEVRIVKSSEFAYVDALTLGDISSLRWMESPMKCNPALQKDKELCSVYFSALNFRDVMLASGKIPPEAVTQGEATLDCSLGLEFSGRDSKGNRVMGRVNAKGLATSVAVSKHNIWPVPDHWTLEEAATVPVVYLTVYYALVMRGRIQKGETVLIHSGSGGVGQAAIAVALSYGCEVFTTVGSKEKKEYLQRIFPQLKDRNFSSSRDLSFETHILKETSKRGVDIVLNSLSEEKLLASVRLLAKNGRFLEIGKFDISKDTKLGMSAFLKNTSFMGIVLEEDGTGIDLRKLHSMIQEGINSGVVRPLRTTVFDKSEVVEAFRYMGQGKHIGKVVVKIRSEEKEKVTTAPKVFLPAMMKTMCSPSKSYIIIGGLGGFGLELGQWLIDRGAKKLVLTSRSGISTGYQKRKLSLWRESGVEVLISSKDIKSEAGTTALLQEAIRLGPVGGIFNSAVVLRDGLLENQTKEMYREVCEPKVQGTIHLDMATRNLCKASLDWFVVFSSLACGRGNLGQTNYGFANSVMERICEKRKADGLHGLAIQWGPIGDVGVLARNMETDDIVLAGTQAQRIGSCLEVLDQLLSLDYSVVSSFVIAQAVTAKKDGNDTVEAIAKIVGVQEITQENSNTTFADMGIDSIMSVEVRQQLERDLDVTLDAKEIRLLTLNKLKEMCDCKNE